MNLIHRTTLVAGAIGLLATACGGNSPEAATPPAASATAAPAASSAAAPASSAAAPVASAAPKAEPASDPIRAAARKVVACAGWSELSVPWDCADLKAFDELGALQEGAGDKTLVEMLADPEPKMVALGARGLRVNGRKFRDDAALAEKIVARLEAGKDDESVLDNLATVAGAIDGEKTKLGPRLLDLAKNIKSPSVRGSFISAGQFHNSDLLYPVTSELARSESNQDLRRTAISAFWTGTPSGKSDEVCKLWVSIGQDPKTPEGLAAQAVDYAAWTPTTCDKQYDAIAKLLEKHLKGKVEETSWAIAGTHLVGQDKLAAPLKKKVVGLLKAVATDPKNGASVRVFALDGVIKGDPAGAKALLAKLAKDKDDYVAKHAAEAATAKKD